MSSRCVRVEGFRAVHRANFRIATGCCKRRSIRPVSGRHLLNHTSGISDYEELFMQAGKVDRNWPRSATLAPSAYEPTAHDVLTRLAHCDTLKFRPDDHYEYSNSGYVLLGQIIEKVSGQRYASFLKQNIFAPLAMTATAVYDETKPAFPNRASSYRSTASGFAEIDYTPFNSIYGADNVVSTLDDLFKWDQASVGNRTDFPFAKTVEEVAAIYLKGRQR